jgi:DNA-binding MarR family transcriptional regulator
MMCKHGHEMTAENTYGRPSGRTECRVCKTEVRRRSRQVNPDQTSEALLAREEWVMSVLAKGPHTPAKIVAVAEFTGRADLTVYRVASALDRLVAKGLVEHTSKRGEYRLVETTRLDDAIEARLAAIEETLQALLSKVAG